MEEKKSEQIKGSSFFKIVFRLTEGIVRLAFSLVVVAIIFAVAYILGHILFKGIRGNDAFNAINNIYWIDRYFPKIPFWYPLQGGGVSTRWGYPPISSITPVIINRLSDISLVGAFQLLGFLSIPLTAIGMYLFVWWRLKSQAGGLIAAVFYILAPASWIWLFDWGFYAENVSYIFFFPALIFFDSFFEKVLYDKTVDFSARIYIVLAAIFGGLLFATHPSPFFSLLMIISISTLIRTFWALRKVNLRLFFKSIGCVAIFALLSILIVGFLSLNYQYYAKHTFSYGLTTELDKDAFIFSYTIPLKPFLGLARIPQDDFKFTLRNMVIPPHIWAPSLLVLVLAPWAGIQVFTFGLIGLISFGLLFKPEIMFELVRLNVPFIGYVATMRAQIVILKFLIPIAGAMGIVAVGRLIVWLPTFWIKKKWKILEGFKKLLGLIVVPTFSLGVATYLIFTYANKPEYMWKAHEVRYGPCILSARDPFFKFIIDICATPEDESISGQREEYEEIGFDKQKHQKFFRLTHACTVRIDLKKEPINTQICQDLANIEKARLEPEEKGKLREVAFTTFVERCNSKIVNKEERAYCPLVSDDLSEVYRWLGINLLEPSYWPHPDLRYQFQFEHIHKKYQGFIEENQDNQWLRIDVSPTLGGVVQGINILSDISIINLYTSQLSLLGPYWGLEQQVLFSLHDGRFETATEVAKYFGTKYLMTSDEHDGVEKYADGKGVWESVGEYPGTIWELKNSPEMYSWYQEKPLILVIGDKEKRAFEPVFRAAIKGAIPYDQAILVEGDERIDSYSLNELKNFDTIFLFGYHYKNQRRAWRLLDQYVKDGGTVYISTGWQYVDADWQWEETVPIVPIDSLSWRDDFTKETKYDYDGLVIGDEKLEEEKLSPLVWADKGWGVSTGKSVKNWAKPILKADGWPLIVAGEYGKGKVIWSGLNLIGHAHTYDYNQEELRLLRSLLKWLKSSSPEDDMTEFVSPRRDYPDKIEFSFTKTVGKPTTFYWREAVFPAWQAKMSTGKKVEIYRGGPGLMAMRLPPVKSGEKLILEFKPGTRGLMVNLITVLTWILVFIYLGVGNRLFKPLGQFYTKIKEQWPRNLKKKWRDDEEETY